MGLISADMKRAVEEQRLGFIATVCPDGTPNLSPKGIVKLLTTLPDSCHHHSGDEPARTTRTPTR